MQKRWKAIDHVIIKQSERFQKQPETRQKAFSIGEKVLIFDSALANARGQKFKPKWKGPFVITDVIIPVLHQVSDSSSTWMVHRDHLKRYCIRRSTQRSDCRDQDDLTKCQICPDTWDPISGI